MVKGIQQYITTGVTIGGTAYTPATLQDVFAGALSAMEVADLSHAKWLADTKAMQAKIASAVVVMRALDKFVEGQFGSNETVLEVFGAKVPKARSTPTAATKAAAEVKRQATRKVRGVMPKKQKQALKGNVQVAITAVPVVTVPAHEAPAPAPAVASPAAAGGGAAGGAGASSATVATRA